MPSKIILAISTASPLLGPSDPNISENSSIIRLFKLKPVLADDEMTMVNHVMAGIWMFNLSKCPNGNNNVNKWPAHNIRNIRIIDDQCQLMVADQTVRSLMLK